MPNKKKQQAQLSTPVKDAAGVPTKFFPVKDAPDALTKFFGKGTPSMTPEGKKPSMPKSPIAVKLEEPAAASSIVPDATSPKLEEPAAASSMVPVATQQQPSAVMPKSEPPPTNASDVTMASVLPPDTSVMPSAVAQRAVTVATSDFAIANLPTEERRRLWMKYLRSRGNTKQGRGVRAGAPEKLPASMADKVNNNLNHYFELWLKCECSWGQVMVHEEQIKIQTTSEERDHEWMYGFDVKKNFPPEIAHGWMTALQTDPTRYQADPLLPDSEDAAMYKILKSWKQKKSKEASRMQKVTLSANAAETSQEGQATAVALMQDKDIEDGEYDDGYETGHKRSAEELAHEEMERQKAKRQKDLEKSDPAKRCTRWLAALPKDIKTCKATILDVNSDTTVPEAEKEKIRSSLNNHLNVLADARNRLEDSEATKSHSVPDLNAATSAVVNMRATIKLWVDLLKVWKQ